MRTHKADDPVLTLNTQKTEMKMTRKAHKLLAVVIAIATIAAGSFAFAKASHAYWIGNTWCDTNYGYLNCIDP